MEDGSPLVRRELVVALQWIVYSFLPTFINLCRTLQTEEEERNRPDPRQPPSPRGSLSRIASEDKFRKKAELNRKPSKLGANSQTNPSLAGSSSVNEINLVGTGDSSTLGTPRKPKKPSSVQLQSSYSALASLSSFTNVTGKYKPFFLKVWGGLLQLEKDPDPATAQLARSLLDLVWRKMCQKDRSADIYRSHGQLDIHSRSAPNSPVRPTFLLGESPPVSLNTTLPTHLDASEPFHRAGQPWMQRSMVSSINEEGALLEEGDPGGISTQFIEWSARYFSTQLMRLNGPDDRESEVHWSREWMHSRNTRLRRIAEADRASLQDGTSRLDEQLGVGKLLQPPSVIAMHPFETEVVVAGRDTVSVYEFGGGQGAQTRSVSFGNKNPKISQITALEFLNGHEAGLLAAGSDDGVVRLYADWQRQQQRLVSAWTLLPELVPQAVAGNRISCGLRLAWDPADRTLAAAGDTKYVRLWDCAAEVKLTDLPSATDSFVTGLSLNESARLLAATHYDGSIRLYDPRLPPTSAR